MLQTLTDIKSLLAGHGLHPKYRYGQNFLHDHGKLRRIIDAAEIEQGDLVLEVGPGTGALSIGLLDAGARLLAVEVDRDLEPILNAQFTPFGDRARLVVGDALEGKHTLSPAMLEAIRSFGQPGTGQAPPQASDQDRGVGQDQHSSVLPAFKLIANLPYNVASPLLANLVIDCPSMSHAVVMIQKEVADRLAAPPGGKDYGPLGILVQALCDVRKVTTLPPGCFWPAPKVSSAVVLLARRAEPMTLDPKSLSKTLQLLFTKRRKQLRGILAKTLGDRRDSFELPAGVQWEQRPEQLSVAQLCQLAESLDSIA